MPRPKDIAERLERISNAWRTLAPEKVFGGMPLPKFEASCAPSNITRAVIAELQDKLAKAMADRDAADEETARLIEFVVNGVRADPSEGPDSALYEAFGYTRKSDRKSGLTRKRSEPITEKQ